MIDQGLLGRMNYKQARQLLLGAGLGVLLLVAGVMYVRRVDPTEVYATLLFIPVFVALVFWDIKGGIAAGLLAGVVYGLLRMDAASQVASASFTGLIASRVAAFLAFGAIGGWANQQLEKSLSKLELYDQIDDYTGLFNARFFVQDTDLELSRSKRYQTIFSVTVVDFPVATLEHLTRRQRRGIRRDLGVMLQEAVRTVDRAVHGFDGTRHRFACVLPETGPEGAAIFTSRLADRMAEFLAERGAKITREQVGALHFTFPDDGEEPIQQLRREFEAIDRHEHPEAAAEQSTA